MEDKRKACIISELERGGSRPHGEVFASITKDAEELHKLRLALQELIHGGFVVVTEEPVKLMLTGKHLERVRESV